MVDVTLIIANTENILIVRTWLPFYSCCRKNKYFVLTGTFSDTFIQTANALNT